MPKIRGSRLVIGVSLLASCSPEVEGVGFVLTEGFAVESVARVQKEVFEVQYRFDYAGSERMCFLAQSGTEVSDTPAVILLRDDGSVVREASPGPMIISVAPDAGEISYDKVSLEPGDGWNGMLEIKVPDQANEDVFFDIGISSQINGVGLQIACDSAYVEPRTEAFKPRFLLKAE